MLFKSLTVTVTLLALLCHCPQLTSSTLETRVCDDPDRETLEDLWAVQKGWHDSVYNVGNLVGTLENMNLDNVPREFVQTSVHPLGASSCPYDNNDRDPIEANRNSPGVGSLCPTYDVMNYDPNRIPETLFEKRCSCNHCAMMHGALPRHGGHTNSHGTGCVGVTYYTRVLRRVGCTEDDVYIYHTILEPITVACTCAYHRRIPVSRSRVHAHPEIR